MKTITLASGDQLKVDDADFDAVSAQSWHVHFSRRKNRTVKYAKTETIVNGRRTIVRLHRWLLGVGPRQLVDHRNGDGLDNRRSNLRVCGNADNLANRHVSYSNSGFLGVHFVKRLKSKPWSAYVTRNRKRRFLGYFATAVEAAQAHDAAARELCGEFAAVNFEGSVPR